MTTTFRRIGAVFLVPLLFLIFGYLTCFVIGAPVIQFVRSSIGIILLNEAPKFSMEHEDVFRNAQDTVPATSVSELDTPASELDTPSSEPVADQPERLSENQFQYPAYGNLYGEIKVSRVQVDEHLYFGDSEDILRLGAGQYNGSVFPGELGTTLVAGHNTSTFNHLDLVILGDQININTSYGSYTYEVTDKQVLTYDDPAAIAQLYDRQERNLILYTCYPVDMLGSTDTRLFIYAKYVSGPIID